MTKIVIEKNLAPELPTKLKRGDVFSWSTSGELFILASSDEIHYVLVSLGSGNRFTNAVKVKGPEFTAEEVDDIFFGRQKQFTKVKELHIKASF